MIKITIGGEDFTTYIVDIPFIDQSCPEWGNVEGLINDTLNLKLPINFLKFFSAESEIEVIYTENNIILFKGFIAQVKHNNKYVELLCKSETYVLFNRHSRENEIISIYYAKNKYPSDIMKELLELSGLSMNMANYYTVTDFYRNLGVTFSVTNENWVTSELLNKLAEVTLSRIFYYNGEFYLEPVFLWDTPPLIEIKKDQWVDYPTIEKWEKYEADYRGTEVKFGEYVSYSIKNERIPEKTVDISFNTVNGIYTDSITTAQHIVDIYDYYYSQPLYRLNGSLKQRAMKNIDKSSFLYWDNRIYSIINIKNSSYTKREIECIGIKSYLNIIKSYKEIGGSIVLDMIHDSLDGLKPSGLANYYHLSQPQREALTQGEDSDSLHWHSHNNLHGLDVGGYLHLTSTQKSALTAGSNADSMHIHSLGSLLGDIDDIADGTTYIKSHKELQNFTHSSGNSIDSIDINGLFWVIVTTYTTNAPFNNSEFYLESRINFGTGDRFQIAWLENDNKRKIRHYSSSSWSSWEVLPSTKSDVINTYNDIITIPESYLSEFIHNSTVSIDEDSPYYGRYWVEIDATTVHDGERWYSPSIPVSYNELFSIYFHAIDIDNGGGYFKVRVYEYDRTNSVVGQTDYNYDGTGSHTYIGERIYHTVSNTDARYSVVKIFVAYTTAWMATSSCKFTNPVIKRNSAEKVYPLIISWDGDGTYMTNTSIDIDANGVISSLTRTIVGTPPAEHLMIYFNSGFLSDNDILHIENTFFRYDGGSDYSYLYEAHMTHKIETSSNRIIVRLPSTYYGWLSDTGAYRNNLKFTLTRLT